MTLVTTRLSLVRPRVVAQRVVAQLQQYGFPILDTLVPKIQFFPEKKRKIYRGEVFRG